MRQNTAVRESGLLNDEDTAAIIREIHGTYHSDAETGVSCFRGQSGFRYQLLQATALDHRTLAVRLLQIPVDRRGRALAGRSSTPRFVVANTGGHWELIGRPMPADE